MNTTISLDNTQTVEVKVANFSAEYGRNNGFTVMAVSKTGTRQLHGAGYYYVSSSTSSEGASIDGVQIVSDSVTKSLGTGTWQIALRNNGALTVSSITAFLDWGELTKPCR